MYPEYGGEEEYRGEDQSARLLPSTQEVLSLKRMSASRSKRASKTEAVHPPSHSVSVNKRQSRLKSVGTDAGVFASSASKRESRVKPPNTINRKDLGLYCTQQIQIPPNLPGILKAFTKAAIRTQPPDLLTWSISYFECMAKGEVPPVKDRLEFISDTATEGLTVGLLQILHKQLHAKDFVTLPEMKEKWRGICMKEKYLTRVWKKTDWDKTKEIEWSKVVALLCTLVGRNMNETMDAVCQILTSQPIGGEPYLEWDEFWDIYVMLSKIDGQVKRSTIEEVRDYLRPMALANHGLIGPRDFKNQNCPSLF